MKRKKVYNWLLAFTRAIVTFGPLIFIVIATLTFAFNHTDTGLSYNQWQDVFDMGHFEDFWSYANSYMSFMNGNVIADIFASLFKNVLSITGNEFVWFVENYLAWIVVAQIAYFVAYLFIWFVEFVTSWLDTSFARSKR